MTVMRSIVLAIVFLPFLPGLSFGAPAIGFGSISHDFGVVSGGEKTVHYVFDFSNRGDQDLIIEKLSAS
jgi:hypothetical protein